MKFFTLGACALAGLTQANLDQATTEVCTGQTATDHANSLISAAGGNPDDYVVKLANLNNKNLGQFMTVMCKSAPWQDNDNPYAPYTVKKWNSADAEQYAKHREDHEARLKWINENGGSIEFPAGSGGKAWCGYDGNGAVTWNDMNAAPLCPNHDEVSKWNEYYEANKIPSKIDEKGICLSLQVANEPGWASSGSPMNVFITFKDGANHGSVLEFKGSKAFKGFNHRGGLTTQCEFAKEDLPSLEIESVVVQAAGGDGLMVAADGFKININGDISTWYLKEKHGSNPSPDNSGVNSKWSIDGNGDGIADYNACLNSMKCELARAP
jgi:hypothetical protein